MDKNNSKYFNTALLFDKALVLLLNKKEYEFITVKEICEKAGVNRSTFYLHYDTIDDLLQECIENSNKEFMSYFPKNNEFFENFNKMNNSELIFITHEYLNPYLNYIKENKVIHQVGVKHAKLMNSHIKFNSMNKHIFLPIFKRFGIDEKSEKYMIQYYINGITAIINEWIKNSCADPIDFIEDLIIKCVDPYSKIK